MITDLSKALFVTTVARSLLLVLSITFLAHLLDHPCFQQLAPSHRPSTLGLLVTDCILLFFCLPISIARFCRLKHSPLYPYYAVTSIIICVALILSRVVLQLI